VIAAGRDDTALVYYSVAGAPPIETLYGHAGEITQAGFGRSDELIATASADGTARVWTGPVAQPKVALPPQAAGADQLANALSFTSDNQRIVEASANGQGRILGAGDLKLVARFVAPTGQGFAGAAEARDGSAVTAVSGPYNPTTRVIAALTNAELYDPATGRLLKTLTPVAPGHLFTATLDFTGGRFATLGFNGDTDVWNTHTGQLLYHLPGDTIAAAAAFSKDGSQLAILHYPAIPTVVTSTTTFGNVVLDLYHAQSGKLERTIQAGQLTPQVPGEASYAPLSVAFSPDGRLLAIGGVDSSVGVYSAQTGGLIDSLPAGPASGDYANSLAFSPDGTYLAVGSTAFATVWRVSSSGGLSYLSVFDQVPAGTVAPYLTGGYGVLVGFTANSRNLITAGDRAIAGWDVSSNLELFHQVPVAKGNMSPSSNEFVTAGLTGLAVYSCDACGDHADLLAAANRITAQTHTSLTPSEFAQG
jgi:WD40 repeat protein